MISVCVSIVCGIVLTWICASVGLARLDRGTCTGPSKANLARDRVKEVEDAIVQFQLDEGRCPLTHEEMIAASYLPSVDRADPWKTRLVFTCSEREVAVMSAGPDRTFNTPDDVTATHTVYWH